ncbi:polysaccharide deacetylase family protein [Cohnella rhizosphaerae]|uniref:Polysaccharide deacetylase family protein n=1 Tax=Cohnella rhizosphaerae TaxID=1457232 RepID=A0A9X4QXH8_9BACL|nr:polysaccharide deacetylase family protein [Cohnella rhizosphaerae]MDG0813507.1 polysaccharide deacetylase family protein [Cohnella rhizosphaerae]
MRLKTRFAALSIVLVMATAAFSVSFVLAYHSRFPVLQRLFYSASAGGGADGPAGAPAPSLSGLKTGADEPNGHYYRDRVLVLMYHDVTAKPTDVRSLSAANFERQLRLMKDNNFHWISMRQYRDFILHGRHVPENAVLLTFDDGYESFYKYAYPLLEKYRAPAASFLIVDTIGNSRMPGVEKLNWDQVKEMHGKGIDFFNHTYDSHYYGPTDAHGKHPEPALSSRLYLKDKGRRETEKEYEARVDADLRQANAVLKRELGEDNHVLAFPYGAFSEPLLRICKRNGIDVTLTVKSGLNKPGQTNGFRLNAGGMSNNPELQLALMKQAKQRLGHAHFDRAPAYKRVAIGSLAAAAASFAAWLYVGIALLRHRETTSSPPRQPASP